MGSSGFRVGNLSHPLDRIELRTAFGARSGVGGGAAQGRTAQSHELIDVDSVNSSNQLFSRLSRGAHTAPESDFEHQMGLRAQRRLTS